MRCSPNPWPFIKDLYQLTQERQVVPEFELFDLGHVATLHRLLAEFGRRPAAMCTAIWSWACQAACPEI